MNELKNLLSTLHVNSNEVCEWLRRYQESIINISFDQEIDIISELFTLIERPLGNYEQSEWDRMQCVILSFIISYWPLQQNIPDLPINNTNDGKVFFYLSYLAAVKITSSLQNPRHKIFVKSVKELLDQNNKKMIYSITNFFYYRNIPQMTSGFPIDKISPFFQRLIQQLGSGTLSPNFYSENILDYIAKIYRIHYKQCKSQELLQFFNAIFSGGHVASTNVMRRFFPLWWQLSCTMNFPSLDLINENITKLAEHITNLLIHDLYKNFLWNHAFDYYQTLQAEHQQARILSFINLVLRTPVRIEYLLMIEEKCLQPFIDSLMKSNNRGHWQFYYMCESIITAFSSINGQLSRIKGIYIGNNPPKYLYFYEQANNRNIREIDHEMYSSFDAYVVNDLTSALEKYEYIWKIYDAISKRINFLTSWLIKFAALLADLYKSENRNEDIQQSSLPLYYFREMIKVFFKFIIVSCHRLMMLQYFMNIVVANNGSKVTPASYLKRSPDFNQTFARFSEGFLKDLPPSFFPIIASVVIPLLFRAVEKHLVSHQLVMVFQQLDILNKPFLSCIIYKMFDFLYGNYELLCSHENSKVLSIQQWIYLMIRIGGTKQSGPNTQFSYILRNNLRVLIFIIMQAPRHIANQKTIVAALVWYIRSIHDNTDKTLPYTAPGRGSSMKLRPGMLELFQDSVQQEIAELFVQPDVFDPTQMSIIYFIPILEKAFISKNNQIIEKAIELVMRYHTPKIFDFDSEKMSNPLFMHMFDQILKAEKNIALTLMDISPSFLPMFIKPRTILGLDDKDYILEPYGISLNELLNGIDSMVLDSEEDAPHVLVFLQLLVKNLKFRRLNSSCLDLIHCLLGNLSKFSTIRKGLDALYRHLNAKFAKRMCHYRVSNAYILSLFHVSCASKSPVTRYQLLKASEFFQFCKTENPPDSLISTIISDLLKIEKPSANQFAVLTALSTIVLVFPEAITVEHIFSYMSLFHVENSNVLIKLLDSFLKTYLANISDVNKKKFIMQVYSNIDNIPFGHHSVFLKRFSKLGIPLQLQSMRYFVSLHESDIYCYKLSMALLCGIEGELNLNSDIIMSSIHASKLPEETMKTNLYALIVLRNMNFFISVLKSNYKQVFLNNEGFVSHMVATIFKNPIKYVRLSYHIKAAFKKAFKLLLKNDHVPHISRKLEEAIRFTDDFKLFFSNPQYEHYIFKIIMKNAPQFCSPQLIKAILQSIIDYSKSNEESRMKHMMSYINVYKLLEIKPYINQDTIREIIHSSTQEGLTYFSTFVLKSLVLFENPELSFKNMVFRSFYKFVALFRSEFISFIFNLSAKEYVLAGYQILEEIIAIDKDFFNEFIQRVLKIPDYLKIYPYVIHIVYKSIKYYPNDTTLSQTIQHLANPIQRAFFDSSKLGNNDFLLMYYSLKAMIRLIKYKFEFECVITLAKAFSYPILKDCDLYYKFKQIVFKKQSKEVVKHLLFYVIDSNRCPPQPLSLILCHSIRALSPITEPTLSHNIWQYCIMQLDNPDFMNAALHCISVFMAKNNDWWKDHLNGRDVTTLKVFQMCFQEFIKDYDPFTITRVFKIAYIFHKNKMLSTKVHTDLIIHVITFPKFSEPPYAKYTLPILKSYNVDPIPDDLAEAFRIYISERSTSIINEFQKIISIIQLIPNLVKCLPFSLFLTFLHSFELRIHNRRPLVANFDKESCLSFMTKACSVLSPTKNELRRFYSLCFTEYLKPIFEGQYEKTRDFSDLFYGLLLKEGCDNLPVELLKIAVMNFKPTTPHLKVHFGFAIICIEFLDKSQILNSAQSLLYLKDAIRLYALENLNLNPIYLRSFFAKVFSCFELTDAFRPLIFEIFERLKKNNSEQGIQKLIFFTTHLLSVSSGIPKFEILKPLWDILLSYGKNMNFQYLKFLFGRIDDIPYDQQIEYLHLIIAKTEKLREVSLQVLPNIFQVKSIINSAKIEFLDLLPNIIDNTCTSTTFQNIYTAIKDEKLVSVKYHVQLLIIIIAKSEKCKKLVYCDILLELLDRDPEARFIQLIEFLPIALWKNEYTRYIAFIIAGKIDRLWTSLFLYAEATNSSSLLEKQITENNSTKVIQLLKDIFCLPNKSAYSIYISAVLPYLSNNRLLYKGMKITNQVHRFKMDGTPIKNRVLLPHALNDQIFGQVCNSLSIKAQAAAAQFFLSNYQEAVDVYESISRDGDMFSEQVFQISKQLLINPIINPGKNDPYLFPHIDKAIGYAQNNLIDVCLTEVGYASQANIMYLRSHPHPSPFEKEKAFTIQMCLHAIKAKIGKRNDERLQLSPNYRDSCLNPILLKYLTDLTDTLNNKPHQEIKVMDNKGDFIVFSPSLSTMFPSVVGYNSHGFAAVNTFCIQRVLEEMQDKPSPKFASFCFTLFTSSPSANFFSLALKTHFDELNILLKEDAPTYMKIALAARIVTLFELATTTHDDDMVRACQELTPLMQIQICECLRVWIYQICDLRWNSWFMDATKEIPDDMTMISALYTKDNSSKEELINKIIPKDRKNFMTLINIEKFFDYIFNIDFEAYEKQRRFEKFLIKLRTTNKIPRNSEFKDFSDLEDLNFFHGDIIDFVERYHPGYAEMRRNIKEKLDNLNIQMPFILPSRIRQMSNTVIYHINEDIHQIAPDLFIFTATNSFNIDHSFVLQKTDNVANSISFSNALIFFKPILRYHYTSRLRGIRLSSTIGHSIGKRYILYLNPSEVVSLQDFYEKSPKEDFLLTEMVNRYSPADFFKLRRTAIRSFAGLEVIRHCYANHAPTLRKTLISPKLAEFPICIADFTAVSQTDRSLMRLSPNLVNFFGPTMKGELTLSIASASNAYVEHFDEFNAYNEILIRDNHDEIHFTLESLLDQRDQIDSRLLEFATPRSVGSTPQDTENWYKGIQEFIENSMDPTQHDEIVFPWY